MKWRYTMIWDVSPAELLNKLNQAGQAGWEVVSVVVQENPEPDRLVAVLKQQLPS